MFISLHHKGCFVAKFITNITNHRLWMSPVPRAHPQEWRRSQVTPERRKEATVAVKCLGNRRQFTTKSSQNLTRIVYSTVGQSLKDHAQKSTAPSLNKPRCSFFDVNVTLCSKKESTNLDLWRKGLCLHTLMLTSGNVDSKSPSPMVANGWRCQSNRDEIVKWCQKEPVLDILWWNMDLRW